MRKQLNLNKDKDGDEEYPLANFYVDNCNAMVQNNGCESGKVTTSKNNCSTKQSLLQFRKKPKNQSSATTSRQTDNNNNNNSNNLNCDKPETNLVKLVKMESLLKQDNQTAQTKTVCSAISPSKLLKTPLDYPEITANVAYEAKKNATVPKSINKPEVVLKSDTSDNSKRTKSTNDLNSTNNQEGNISFTSSNHLKAALDGVPKSNLNATTCEKNAHLNETSKEASSKAPCGPNLSDVTITSCGANTVSNATRGTNTHSKTSSTCGPSTISNVVTYKPYLSSSTVSNVASNVTSKGPSNAAINEASNVNVIPNVPLNVNLNEPLNVTMNTTFDATPTTNTYGVSTAYGVSNSTDATYKVKKTALNGPPNVVFNAPDVIAHAAVPKHLPPPEAISTRPQIPLNRNPFHEYYWRHYPNSQSVIDNLRRATYDSSAISKSLNYHEIPSQQNNSNALIPIPIPYGGEYHHGMLPKPPDNATQNVMYPLNAHQNLPSLQHPPLQLRCPQNLPIENHPNLNVTEIVQDKERKTCEEKRTHRRNSRKKKETRKCDQTNNQQDKTMPPPPDVAPSENLNGIIDQQQSSSMPKMVISSNLLPEYVRILNLRVNCEDFLRLYDTFFGMCTVAMRDLMFNMSRCISLPLMSGDNLMATCDCTLMKLSHFLNGSVPLVVWYVVKSIFDAAIFCHANHDLVKKNFFFVDHFNSYSIPLRIFVMRKAIDNFILKNDDTIKQTVNSFFFKYETLSDASRAQTYFNYTYPRGDNMYKNLNQIPLGLSDHNEHYKRRQSNPMIVFEDHIPNHPAEMLYVTMTYEFYKSQETGRYSRRETAYVQGNTSIYEPISPCESRSSNRSREDVALDMRRFPKSDEFNGNTLVYNKDLRKTLPLKLLKSAELNAFSDLSSVVREQKTKSINTMRIVNSDRTIVNPNEMIIEMPSPASSTKSAEIPLLSVITSVPSIMPKRVKAISPLSLTNYKVSSPRSASSSSTVASTTDANVSCDETAANEFCEAILGRNSTSGRSVIKSTRSVVPDKETKRTKHQKASSGLSETIKIDSEGKSLFIF